MQQRLPSCMMRWDGFGVQLSYRERDTDTSPCGLYACCPTPLRLYS
jgi:hypothetical protein